MAWYLQIGENAPQVFGNLNCFKLKREIRSQAAGTFSFTEAAGQMDEPALANNLDVCQVLWGDTVYFQGRITSIPRAGAPASEERRYVISDPWLDLERLTYQQQWNTIQPGLDQQGNPNTAYEYRSEFILGVDINGNAQNSDAAIIDVLNWAIARGANLQIGTIFKNAGGESTAAPVPFKEMRDLPCSGVIQELLRLTPDAVTSFDYTTVPPTFKVIRRADCAAVSVPLIRSAQEVQLSPRWDLMRSQVLLRYVAYNSNNAGVSSTTTTVDAAPAGADGMAFDALVATVRLSGSDTTYQKVPVQVKAIEAIPQGDDDTNACNWWGDHVAWLYQFSADRLNLDDDSTGGYVRSPQYKDDGTTEVSYNLDDYPNELTKGHLADWMGVNSAAVTFYSAFTYNYPDEADDESLAAVKVFGGSTDGTNKTATDQTPIPVTVTITGTNAATQTYLDPSGYEAAEPVPEGFAAVLYDALSVLHYQGQYTVVAGEVGQNDLGTTLNITGSNQEWGGMNALVQEIADDLDEGRTTWKMGPPGHLTVQDLMEQLRWTRTRLPSGHVNEKCTGTPGAPTINTAPKDPMVNSDTAPHPTPLYPWIDYTDNQDNDDGTGATWDALLGYGQSSFANSDGVDHAGPLEKIELSAGNDGSDWTGPDHDSSDLYNAFSLICGDDTEINDQLLLGRTDSSGKGGSCIITPYNPSFLLSPNLDGSTDGDGVTGSDHPG
jgi:hypothetical protein